MPTIEEKVSALETKFAVAAAIVATLLGVFGISSVVLLPKMAKEAADNAMKEGASKEVSSLLAKSKEEEKEIAQLTKNGTMTIDGQCFRPRVVLNCTSKRDNNNHAYAFDNCSSDRDKQNQFGTILAQCN